MSRTVRIIREVTKGVTPGTAMTVLPFGEFKGTETLEREVGINVQGSRQPLDHAATMSGASWTARSDGMHKLYQPLTESLFGALAVAGPSAFAGSAVFATPANTIAATGIGTGLVVGDIVWVTGATTNGTAFQVRLSVVTANLITVDANWKTLLAETVAINLYFSRRYRIGSLILTNSVELFDGTRGDVLRGAATGSINWSFDHPSKWEVSYAGNAMAMAPISAALANTSTTPALSDIWGSGENFGLQATAAAGCGFRYTGDLVPDLHVKGLEIAVTNPVEPYGAAGSTAPYDMDEQEGQLRECTITLTICRDNADAEAIIADASDPDTVCSIAFTQGDTQGNMTAFHFPELRPTPADRDGLKQGGKSMATLTYAARAATVEGMVQITEVDAA